MATETQKINALLLEQYSTTASIFKDIQARYRKLRFPEGRIGTTDIAYLTERMSPIIARPTEIDPASLTNQIVYVASRVPREIFLHDADVQIKFNDDPAFFLNHQDRDGKPDAKTARDRKRLYVVDEIEEPSKPKKRVITIHAQSQTAVVETMVHASVIELLRGYLTGLVKAKAAAPTIAKTESDPREKIIKKLMNLFVEDPTTSTRELNEWLTRKMEFVGGEGLPDWKDLKGPTKTAKAIAAETAKALEGANMPQGIMFSNSYSLTNILSHYLLSEEVSGGARRKVLIRRALESWYDYDQKGNSDSQKNPLVSLGESLSKMKLRDVFGTDLNPQTQFRIDNLILFYLTRQNGNGNGFHDPEVDAFLAEFNSPERLEKLGYKRLVNADTSPTADPVDYIDFSNIPDEVIGGLNPLIRDAVFALKRNFYSTIYMPYAPGDLTYSIITEMKSAMKSIRDVMEVGKVAHYVAGFTSRKFSDIGHLVLPKHTFDITDPKAPVNYANHVKIGHLELFEDPRRLPYETALIQFPSVILQESSDIESYLVRTFGDVLDKQHFTINMEVSSFREAVNRSDLGLRLFEADYISDHAVTQNTINNSRRLGKENVFKQITKKLDEEGVQGVHATTAAVILALSQAQ